MPFEDGLSHKTFAAAFYHFEAIVDADTGATTWSDAPEVLALPLVRRCNAEQRFFAAARKVSLLSLTSLAHLNVPAHSLLGVRQQVGRYFGNPEDTWRVVAGSSVIGGWSRWMLDDKIGTNGGSGEYRERSVTSVMESSILHFWSALPFVIDVPVHRIPKMLTLTGMHNDRVNAQIDYNVAESDDDTDNRWRPPSKQRLTEVKTETEWGQLIKDHPLTSMRKREYMTGHAIMLAGLEGSEFSAQRNTGSKMLWELASQREAITEFPVEAVQVVLANIRDSDPSTRWYACSAAWCLTPVTAFRRHLSEHGLVEMLYANLGEVVDMLDDLSEAATFAWRASLGALSVCTVDKACRRRLLDTDATMSVLIALAEALATAMNTNTENHWGVMMRVVEVYCSVLVRDPHARQVLIANHALSDVPRIIALPGLRSNFAAGAVYAAFACDAEAMASMRTKEHFGELRSMLRDCVDLTAEQLDMLIPKPMMARQSRSSQMASVIATRKVVSDGSKSWRAERSGGRSSTASSYVEMSASFADDHVNRHYSNIVSATPMKMSEKVEIARMTAEAAVLSVWGSAHSVLTSDAGASGMPPGVVDRISEFAVRTLGKGNTLGKIPESLAGCLCVLSKDPVIGPILIESPSAGTVQSLIRPTCNGAKNSVGVRAAASACVATLAQPSGKSLAGANQRRALLDSGTYTALLESVSAPQDSHVAHDGQDRLREQLEEAASLALMYLSCDGDARPPHEVGKVLMEISKCNNLAAGQYLAASVWGLLRNPANRTAFMTPVREVIFAAGRLADVEAREKNIAKAAADAVNATATHEVSLGSIEEAESALTRAKKRLDDHALGGQFCSCATDEDRVRYAQSHATAESDLADAQDFEEECEDRAKSLHIYAQEVAVRPGHWEVEEAAHKAALQAWEVECKAMNSAAVAATIATVQTAAPPAAAQTARGGLRIQNERMSAQGKMGETVETEVKGGSRPPPPSLPPKPLSRREQEELTSLPDRTGLELLGVTGLGWLEDLVSCDVSAEGDDPPVQVAMEFLVAAVWLGMTTGAPAKPSADVIWALSAPPGGASTWWKMSLLERPLFERSDPTGMLSSAMSPSPVYLQLLLELSRTPGWGRCKGSRIRAFAAVWSLAAEDPSSQHVLIDMGFAAAAATVAGEMDAPVEARGFAAGLMLILATQAEAGLADAGGWGRVEDVLISLASSEEGPLVLQGCRAMAWEVYHRDGAEGVSAARSLASKGAVCVLLSALYRAHQVFRADATRDSLDLIVATTRALLNLSVVSDNQEAIAKGQPGPGLLLLLRINLSFTELQSEHPDHAPTIVRLSALLLQNLKGNPANRTVFYKAELRGTALREAELEAVSPSLPSSHPRPASFSTSNGFASAVGSPWASGGGEARGRSGEGGGRLGLGRNITHRHNGNNGNKGGKSEQVGGNGNTGGTVYASTSLSTATSSTWGTSSMGSVTLDPMKRRVKASVNRPLTSSRSRRSADKVTEQRPHTAGSNAGLPLDDSCQLSTTGPISGSGGWNKHSSRVRGAKQAEAASLEVIHAIHEMSSRSRSSAVSSAELSRRRRAADLAAKVGAASTEELEAELLAVNRGDKARHLPRLIRGLCQPLRNLWEQDVSLGLANPWSPEVEYVHPQKMKAMPELAERLLAITPPPDAGELRRELEKQLQKTLRPPTSGSVYGQPVGVVDKDVGGMSSDGEPVGDVVRREGSSEEIVGDPTDELRFYAPTVGAMGAAASACSSESEVADVLTVNSGDVRPSSARSTIPTITLHSVDRLLPCVSGAGSRDLSGRSNHGGARSDLSTRSDANGGASHFIMSGKGSQGRKGSYPLFGSGVIPEVGRFRKMLKTQQHHSAADRKTLISARNSPLPRSQSGHPAPGGLGIVEEYVHPSDETNGVESTSGDEHRGGFLGLKISVAPEGCSDRSSAAVKGSVITFDEDVKSLDGRSPGGDNPKLYMFEAVEGSRVYDGLLKTFVLPNGHKAHFYFSGKAVSDAVDSELSVPPRRPANGGDVRDGLPTADVMHQLSLPKLDHMTAFRPRPELPKLPEYTELPEIVGRGTGGHEEASLQVLVTTQRITKKVTYTEREVPPPPKAPWKIHASVFSPRARESDARGFFDTESILRKACARDWERMTAKDKFATALQREAKATGSAISIADQIEGLNETILGFYPYIMAAFTYYAALSITGVFHLQLNQYTQCLEDAYIPSADSKGCRKSDCDTLFILCNYVENKDDKQLREVNDDHAMLRFEFIEVLTRLAVAKYGKGWMPEGNNVPLSLPEAFRHLMKANILPNLPSEALQDPNKFRRDRLYFEECDDIFKEYRDVLAAIYDAHRIRDARSGQRSKHLKIDQWLSMVEACLLVDRDLTTRECSLCFVWARTTVADEVGSFRKLEALTFVDFIEAISRLSDYLRLPTREQLETYGWGDNILAYWLAKRQMAASAVQGSTSFSQHSPSSVAKKIIVDIPTDDVVDSVNDDEQAQAAAINTNTNTNANAVESSGSMRFARKSSKLALDVDAGPAGRLIPKEIIELGSSRALSDNIKLVIELMARALHYKRGANPLHTYSYDETLKMLKKVDKANGGT